MRYNYYFKLIPERVPEKYRDKKYWLHTLNCFKYLNSEQLKMLPKNFLEDNDFCDKIVNILLSDKFLFPSMERYASDIAIFNLIPKSYFENKQACLKIIKGYLHDKLHIDYSVFLDKIPLKYYSSDIVNNLIKKDPTFKKYFAHFNIENTNNI